MASASSLLAEDQFLCSICLIVFTDPITTPCGCGQYYCKTCITRYWDTNDVVCQCPLCTMVFDKRPEVFVNTVISEMADQSKKTEQLKISSNTNQEPAKPDEVSCDICTETKLKALKSCLVCLASYCETHLEPHQRVSAFKRHKLIDPVKNLEGIMCEKHDRPLELFCKTDYVCVCQFCTQSDHKLHQIISLKEGYDGKKAELEVTEAEVQRMIQQRQLKIQEVKQSLDLSKKDADKEITDNVQVFTTLIRCIERSQAEVVHVIEEKQKTTKKQADGFIKGMEQEITELEKRSSELKQLLHTEDHIHFLQNVRSINTPLSIKDWTKVNVHHSSYGETMRTAVAQLEKTLSLEMKKLCEAELRRIQQYAVDVTLDPDTAHCELFMSSDGKQVNDGRTKKNLPVNTKKNLPVNTKRFSRYIFVLGKQSFSSGRFYYEVQVKDKTQWFLGVARESIDRKLDSIIRGPTNGYWTIDMINGNEYYAAADIHVLLPVREKAQKVGVFVDYEEGLVSFYDVETGVIIHSYTGCTFTERLCPFFCPGLNEGGKNSAPLIISPVNHPD